MRYLILLGHVHDAKYVKGTNFWAQNGSTLLFCPDFQGSILTDRPRHRNGKLSYFYHISIIFLSSSSSSSSSSLLLFHCTHVDVSSLRFPEPTFFCSSLLESEPTCLRSEELTFEAKTFV